MRGRGPRSSRSGMGRSSACEGDSFPLPSTQSILDGSQDPCRQNPSVSSNRSRFHPRHDPNQSGEDVMGSRPNAPLVLFSGNREHDTWKGDLGGQCGAIQEDLQPTSEGRKEEGRIPHKHHVSDS